MSPYQKFNPASLIHPDAVTAARLANISAVLMIATGLFFRLRQYILNLSLWLDEAMLALNIVGRDFAGLARPLDYDQGAPPGFLWIVKFFQLIFGSREYSLRLFPFLAGCLALVVFWLVARQLLRPLGALFALGLFALSSFMISYAAQVKQYGVDAAISLLLYLLGLRLLRRAPGRRDYWLLGLGGALAVWVSHPAVFVLGGMGLVLILDAWQKKDRRRAGWYALAALFWLLNFALLYFIQFRNLAANGFLTGYWTDFFMPLSTEAPGWIFGSLSGLLTNLMGAADGWPTIVKLILLLAGLISLCAQERRWSWMFALSLILTLAASALHKYPFGGRFGLFAVPGLFICAGEGLDLLRRLFGARKTWGALAAILTAGILLYSPFNMAVQAATSPKMTENIAPTMAYLQSSYRPGDEIYVYRMAIPAWRFYASRYGLANATVLEGGDYHLDRSGYDVEVQKLAGKGRVWFLFSHMTDPEYALDQEAILLAADKLGSKKREFSQPTTLISLYLYDQSR